MSSAVIITEKNFNCNISQGAKRKIVMLKAFKSKSKSKNFLRCLLKGFLTLSLLKCLKAEKRKPEGKTFGFEFEIRLEPQIISWRTGVRDGRP